MNRIFQWISRNIKRLVAEHQRKLTEPKSVPRIPDQKVKLTVAESELNSLSHFATLDTLVTVVDALNIYDVLGSIETLADKDNLAGMVGNTGAVQKVYLSAQPTTEPDVPEEAQQQPQQQPGHEGHEHDQPQAGDAAPAVVDDRSLSQLMLDQIEFADVIVVSKASIFLGQRSEQELDSVRALLSRLNPKARVLVPLVDQYGDMDVARELLNTGLFDMEAAQQSAGWQLELANADHVPETEEYGISSTVFRAHDMPFHPGRLKSILNGFGNYSTATALSAESSSSGSEGVAAEEVFHGVVRAKGSLWLANAHAYPINFHAAGRQVSLEAGGMPFRVTMCDPATHRNQVAAGKWRPKFGDRGSVVVFIGVHLNRRLIAEKLREALLTEAESAALGGVRGWRGLADPFMGGSCADRFFDVPEHLRTMSATAEEASFHDEIADMIAARIAEGAAVDMVVADMNSLRVSHDADVVVDLIPAVVPVLLDAATPSDSEKEYTKALSEVIKRWSGVLTACLRDEQDQLALLGTVFEWLTSKEDERRLQQARFTLMVLYQADIVEEDVLLRWAAELREDEAADPDVASVLAQCNKFFTWLQEADTESSGADDGAGGDSKPS
jgi:G3E family GTPase